jgi:Divergent InlB B-repeat domain/NHL repeat
MTHQSNQPRPHVFQAATRSADALRACATRRLLALLLPFALLLALGSSPAAATQPHAFVRSFGSPGTGAGQFGFTTESSLAVDQSNGDVYAADTVNHRIEKFSPSGAFLFAFGWGVKTGNTSSTGLDSCTTATGCQAGFPGHGPGQFEAPTFIAVDNTPGGAGDVYIVNKGAIVNKRQSVTISATAGTYTLSFTTTQRGTTTSGSNLVTGISTNVHSGYKIGDAVSGPGIPAGTTITAIDYVNHKLTLSANATASATAVLAITETTAAITYNASATELRSALEGMGVLEEGGVSVSGSAGGPYTVEFTRFIGINLPQMTADSSGLSGAAATATVATVLDGFNGNRVQKFDSSGNLLTAWGGTPVGGQLDGTMCLPGEIECPGIAFSALEGVLVKPDGNLLVLDGSYREWAQSGGEYIAEYGAFGTRQESPTGVAVDPAGHVYQSEPRYPITRPPTFKVVQTFLCDRQAPGTPCPPVNGGELRFVYLESFTLDPGPATGFAVDPSDEAVYVARYNAVSSHSDIGSYDSAGHVLESSFGGNGEITTPAGIAVSGFAASEGDVYVADKGSNRIEIFAPGGPRAFITVTRSGTGLGSVTSQPAGIACPSLCSTGFPEGEVLTLNATAPEHSTFTGWSGGGCAGTGACQVTLNADTAVTATFAYDRPVLTPPAASAITRNTATLNGTVNPEGDASLCGFQYGTTTAYDAEAPCLTQPGSVAGPVPVSAELWDLAAGTTYHYRLVSANSGGTSYGPDQTFTTESETCATNAALCPARPVEVSLTSQALVLPRQLIVTPKEKALINAQKLANALKACRKYKKKSVRVSCEKQVRKRYAPAKKKAKKPTAKKRG